MLAMRTNDDCSDEDAEEEDEDNDDEDDDDNDNEGDEEGEDPNNGDTSDEDEEIGSGSGNPPIPPMDVVLCPEDTPREASWLAIVATNAGSTSMTGLN